MTDVNQVTAPAGTDAGTGTSPAWPDPRKETVMPAHPRSPP
jgi:hypothetical protein